MEKEKNDEIDLLLKSICEKEDVKVKDKNQVTISYKTLDEINKEMSGMTRCVIEYQEEDFIIKNNELDLTGLGPLIKLRLPKEVLMSEEQVKIFFSLNIAFDSMAEYKSFFKNGCIVPETFKTIDCKLVSLNSERINDIIIKNDGFLFYEADNGELKQLGKVNCIKYDDDEDNVYVELLVSKEITGTSYLFSSQNDLVSKCTNAIRRDDDKRFLELFPHLIDKKIPNEDGNTLEFLAAWYGKVNLLKHIREYVRLDPNVSLSGARHSKVLEYLKSVDDFHPFYKDKDGFNPLQQACNISAPGDFFYSDIIEEDAILDRIKSIDIILSHGVDINIKNNFGRTPLTCACDSSKDCTLIVEHLLSKGADANIVCNDGKKALDYTESDELTELLLKKMDIFINYMSVFRDFIEISKNTNNEDLEIIKKIVDNLDSLSYFSMVRKIHTLIDEEFINELKKIMDFYNRYKKLSQYNFAYFNEKITEIGVLARDYPLKVIDIN